MTSSTLDRSASRPMHPVAQTWALARRSILAVSRQPAVFIPAVFFPLFIAAVNASAIWIARWSAFSTGSGPLSECPSTYSMTRKLGPTS